MELYLYSVAPRFGNACNLFSIERVSILKRKASVGEWGNLKSYNEKKVRQIPRPSFMYFVSWKHKHGFQAAFTIASSTMKLNVFLSEQ
jgi:hypothetical protein